eukprot:676628-Hanusia_phi.AAC.3
MNFLFGNKSSRSEGIDPEQGAVMDEKSFDPDDSSFDLRSEKSFDPDSRESSAMSEKEEEETVGDERADDARRASILMAFAWREVKMRIRRR